MFNVSHIQYVENDSFLPPFSVHLFPLLRIHCLNINFSVTTRAFSIAHVCQNHEKE